MKKKYWILTVLIPFLLSSCSFLSPVPAESQNKYVLNTLPQAKIKKPKRQVTLFVTQPETHSSYQTKQMAYSTQPYQIAYFAKNVWGSKPAEMLHPLIIQSLQKTHYYHAIIAPPVSGRFDYSLNTQIEELLQDYTHQTAILRLTVRAEIVRMSTYKVIATKEFVITQPILQKSPYGGVYAANQAAAEMLQQLTQFCLKNT